mmetsp:Transcript_45085/g.71636  ORF Transcript_45085/g.71636 Transcript_45085/m.71636 type:complete len:119 (+) Transcript_45085:44-400(+)
MICCSKSSHQSSNSRVQITPSSCSRAGKSSRQSSCRGELRHHLQKLIELQSAAFILVIPPSHYQQLFKRERHTALRESLTQLLQIDVSGPILVNCCKFLLLFLEKLHQQAELFERQQR